MNNIVGLDQNFNWKQLFRGNSNLTDDLAAILKIINLSSGRILAVNDRMNEVESNITEVEQGLEIVDWT